MVNVVILCMKTQTPYILSFLSFSSDMHPLKNGLDAQSCKMQFYFNVHMLPQRNMCSAYVVNSQSDKPSCFASFFSLSAGAKLINEFIYIPMQAPEASIMLPFPPPSFLIIFAGICGFLLSHRYFGGCYHSFFCHLLEMIKIFFQHQ